MLLLSAGSSAETVILLNPGPAAIGYTIEAEDWSDVGSDHLGGATCNEAEYRALIRGLEVVSEQGCTEVETRGDSQLVVRQVADDSQTTRMDGTRSALIETGADSFWRTCSGTPLTTPDQT